MMKHFAIGLLAAVCISLAAKHDNAFLNKVTNDYYESAEQRQKKRGAQ